MLLNHKKSMKSLYCKFGFKVVKTVLHYYRLYRYYTIKWAQTPFKLKVSSIIYMFLTFVNRQKEDKVRSSYLLQLNAKSINITIAYIDSIPSYLNLWS